jgi:two-component system chemotaxis response regulator CheY
METEPLLLLVDGDESARQRLGLRLSTRGFRVVEAGNLEDAKKLILGNHPAMVISEWGLPGIGGPELVQSLHMPAKKVCIFTSRPVDSLAEEAARLGVAAKFHKNDRYELLEFLENHLLGRSTSAAPVDSRNLEILLIDDSKAIRMAVRATLETEFPGSRIREAENGRNALSEMSQKKVDLIVTDLEMPGMDGREFLSLVQSNAILRRKPIIVFSSNIKQDLIQAYGSLGNIQFLHKPCEPARLAETARQLLSQFQPYRS